MAIKILALFVLLLVLWVLFRFAMGLRAAKLVREATRRAAELSGRRVVAELPVAESVLFFVDEPDAFAWGVERLPKNEVRGARLLLNGAVMASFGDGLPPPPAPGEFEGRERWEVVVYRQDGQAVVVPCGTLREGVSREVANRVFAAVREGADFG